MMRSKIGTAVIASMVLVACGPQATPLPAQPLPEADSPVAKMLVDRCGRCHGAPNPAVHTAFEWPSVIHRMQNRMSQKGVKVLSDDELATLIAYLQKYARGAS